MANFPFFLTSIPLTNSIQIRLPSACPKWNTCICFGKLWNEWEGCAGHVAFSPMFQFLFNVLNIAFEYVSRDYLWLSWLAHFKRFNFAVLVWSVRRLRSDCIRHKWIVVLDLADHCLLPGQRVCPFYPLSYLAAVPAAVEVYVFRCFKELGVEPIQIALKFFRNAFPKNVGFQLTETFHVSKLSKEFFALSKIAQILVSDSRFCLTSSTYSNRMIKPCRFAWLDAKFDS